MYFCTRTHDCNVLNQSECTKLDLMILECSGNGECNNNAHLGSASDGDTSEGATTSTKGVGR